MGRQICRWLIAQTPDEAFGRAADLIAAAAASAIEIDGRFRIVVSGGRTPPLIYEKLTGIDTNWGAWEIYFSDERCLPSGHTERNDRLAWDTWLSRIGGRSIPKAYPIPAELGPDKGAKEYANLLQDISAFDFALLGVGEDGHTASLFPGEACMADANTPAAIPVVGAPKWPSERVSLSPWRLSATASVIFVAVGAEKRPVVEAWRAGTELPVATIRPASGVDVILDAQCAGGCFSRAGAGCS
jgi:6-phosphogluconolactonase